MSGVRWLGAVTIPTVLNAPKGMAWGCTPNDIFADTPLKRGTRYRFIVFAPVGTSDQDVIVAVDAAGFFGLDAKVGCTGWDATDPKAVGADARCVEATYIGSVTSTHVLCARAVGCWAGWGAAPPCKPPPPCEPGNQCFQPLPVPTPVKPVSTSSGSGGFLLIALAAVGLVAATLSIKTGPAPVRQANPGMRRNVNQLRRNSTGPRLTMGLSLENLHLAVVEVERTTDRDQPFKIWLGNEPYMTTADPEIAVRLAVQLAEDLVNAGSYQRAAVRVAGREVYRAGKAQVRRFPVGI